MRITWLYERANHKFQIHNFRVKSSDVNDISCFTSPAHDNKIPRYLHSTMCEH
jgi:hypothetical protein